MADTAFAVPENKQDRLVAYYLGADLMNPMKPGLTRTDNAPYPGAYLRPVPRLSGGGGMVSTLPDMVALIRSLLPGGPTLLKPDTIALAMTNQLPEGTWMRFPEPGCCKARGLDWRAGWSKSLRRPGIRIRPANSIGAASPARNGGFRRKQASPA